MCVVPAGVLESKCFVVLLCNTLQLQKLRCVSGLRFGGVKLGEVVEVQRHLPDCTAGDSCPRSNVRPTFCFSILRVGRVHAFAVTTLLLLSFIQV